MKDTEFVTVEFLQETGYWDKEYGMARSARPGTTVTAGITQAKVWERGGLVKIVGAAKDGAAPAPDPMPDPRVMDPNQPNEVVSVSRGRGRGRDRD